MAEPIDLDALEEAALAALVKMAANGSASAAKDVLAVVDRHRAGRVAEAHQARMLELRERPVELCDYLAEIHVPPETVEELLGRAMKRPELDAYRRGEVRRTVLIRAVEMAAVSAGRAQASRGMRQTAPLPPSRKPAAR